MLWYIVKGVTGHKFNGYIEFLLIFSTILFCWELSLPGIIRYLERRHCIQNIGRVFIKNEIPLLFKYLRQTELYKNCDYSPPFLAVRVRDNFLTLTFVK